jgi:hypothetical protein
MPELLNNLPIARFLPAIRFRPPGGATFAATGISAALGILVLERVEFEVECTYCAPGRGWSATPTNSAQTRHDWQKSA